MNHKIDLVIAWVDGSDPIWLQEKKKWYEKINPDSKSNSNVRYESWDNLQYWFRAIEKYMPWYNNIFFITYGHIPSFLNCDNSRLKIIRHSDYIPQEFLPTFNANTIEMNLHRIEGLSENFIYFNDDMFPLRSIKESYYFQNDKICDEAIETPIIPQLFGDVAKFTWNMRALDVAVINRNFNKRMVQKINYEKWFSDEYGELLERNKTLSYWNNFVGFRDPHVPSAFKKNTFEKLWIEEEDVLVETCKSKFRNFSCVNQWLARYWQLCEGDFVPRKTLGKSYIVTLNNYKEIAMHIKNRSEQMICINEDCTAEEFNVIKNEINQAFEYLLPEKSSFEK